MKAIEILREVLPCNIVKGIVYARYKVLEGKLKPRATYYFTFEKCSIVSHNPDAVVLCPSGEEMYFYKVER